MELEGTPTVPVPEKDGSVRICGENKVTVNHRLEKKEDSKKHLTINTHMGLFQYNCNRLVFDITSASAIRQRTIDQVLGGTSGTICIHDHMMITGGEDQKHKQI